MPASCATSGSLASASATAACTSARPVPLRDSTLALEEILMSESQERMMAVVEPGDVEAFLAICAKWGRRGDRDRGGHRQRPAADRLARRADRRRAPRSVAHDGPTYHRPYRRPAWQDALQADGAEALARPTTGDEPARDPAPPGRQPEPLRQVGSPTSTTGTSAATRSSPRPSDSG